MEVPSLYDQKILFQQIANDSVSAFRALFDSYKTRLYAAALKITKSDYAAEEIVQEVFATLWEGRSNLAVVDNPSAYIFTIAYHKAFRYLKKAAADKALFKSLIHTMEEVHNDTEEWLQAKESQEIINQMVEGMPPQRQLIFRLSREKKLSHKEIASQLNISPLTVKKQLVLALRNIRVVLARKDRPLILFFLFNLF
ncbi:MAG TPA: RNA polymerase sigma-70 factor [Chitinophagaceae bacterium]